LCSTSRVFSCVPDEFWSHACFVDLAPSSCRVLVRLGAKGAWVLVWCACVVAPRSSWWLKRVPRGHRARTARLARGSASVARAARPRVQQLDPRPRGEWKRRLAHDLHNGDHHAIHHTAHAIIGRTISHRPRCWQRCFRYFEQSAKLSPVQLESLSRTVAASKQALRSPMHTRIQKVVCVVRVLCIIV
jgi:hypothetical protein